MTARSKSPWHICHLANPYSGYNVQPKNSVISTEAAKPRSGETRFSTST
ncbi:MAG: hypothetical protein PW789_13345 [Edaphobacter sp.]|nr:hypothetical protein [Edaphobacter sp.]MDE1177569.1 hypothetical protein [Edaphobacter sp.]